MNLFINVIIALAATIIVMFIDNAFFDDIAKNFNIETATGIRCLGFLPLIVGSPIAVIFNLNNALVFFEFAGFTGFYILITMIYYVAYCIPENQ